MISANKPPIVSKNGAAARGAASGNGNGAAPGQQNRIAYSEGGGEKFTVSHRVEHGAGGRPYERTSDDPLHRRLRIYTVDPGTRQADGAVATVKVPYEPLKKSLRKGLKGFVFHVKPVFSHPDAEDGSERDNIDLNDPLMLLTDGRAPSPVDPRFHQQMVYAVASMVYDTFRRALGRHVAWGFDHRGCGKKRTRLLLSPHGRQGHAGASYDRVSGEVRFGFVRTESNIDGRAAPGGHAFSCVSHDIVTHEVTHALLDGLRAHFLEPTSADVLGFHEGFADLMALLHRFSYKEVLRSAMRRYHGKVLKSALITSIATEFGRSIGIGGAVRNLLANAKADMAQTAAAQLAVGGAGLTDEELPVITYRPDMQPHEMGEVFVSAVLHAFATVYTRKAERYLRLATNGTGVLPPGDISPDLQDLLAEEASQLASQFLNVCIRAIDYCPPVDLQLGEFLRAVITADLDLVPDDPWGYREAWIDAFAKHELYPRDVQSMSEDALKWEPRRDGLVVKDLSFTQLEFDGDPAYPASRRELRRRAHALGKFVADHPDRFGMLPSGHPHLAGDDVTVPEVQSVRSSRRVGPDGQVVFDLVAEVTQTRYVDQGGEKGRFLFRGGCTVILGPKGEVRYVIGKSVGQNSRVFRQRKFMLGAGREHFTLVDGWNVPDAETVQFAHQHGRPQPADPGPPANGKISVNAKK